MAPQNQDLWLAWYGDDFTGASAVMEVLTFAGVPSMLFLDVPTPEQLARFPDLRAIGVASTARAQNPDWMDRHLPDVFARLRAMNPQLLHYKVCSTLDSSPEVGSIGRATEIGAKVMNSPVVPVMVAAPQMRRYQCFGHLFAGMGAEVHRLDRHPVMSRHPVTPMDESDVALHISRQSDRIDPALLSLEQLASGAALPDTAAPDRIKLVSLDSMDHASDTAAGRVIWTARDKSRFVVGSQGVEFALVAHWQDTGALDVIPPPPGIGRSDGMVSVSGSVSPTTADQINWSRNNGFACIEFDATAVCHGAKAIEAEIDRCCDAARAALSDGRDPLIYTASGPDDPAVARLRAAVSASAIDMPTANHHIGATLGRLLARVLAQNGLRRAVVSGGDTSGFATQELGIFALSALAPTIPGASIFRAHARGAMDGLELALKGGQMGSPDYFGWVRDGGGLR
ncbi:four-carbon acid sugar kinase family protein [Marinovum sp. 2_MG-2023]|uniref:four-carbon acid sugar kinase family protein n=1 Tax=unclassified Marinovum TaxID=2647166 RepID=UPI0026E3910C|nr:MULTISPECIES: four-carbon acid sugar kinase family protein [unclassified Marinovum]MDO6731244.1 four-carbon acid sugar kinase family protein [Marinovum sp. 2_MG-2023]MDO6780604.1 four-carbon acid sugar kinase family protein [Marinovum sp. 1_MG-2023]